MDPQTEGSNILGTVFELEAMDTQTNDEVVYETGARVTVTQAEDDTAIPMVSKSHIKDTNIMDEGVSEPLVQSPGNMPALQYGEGIGEICSSMTGKRQYSGSRHMLLC